MSDILKGKNMQKTLSIGEFLKLPNAYVISVDDVNIGHTAVIEDVSQDNIHFVGVDEIVTFTHKTMFTENHYVFSTNSLLYVTKDNYSGAPYCQHLYSLEDVSGQKVLIELGFVTALYQMEKTNG